MLSVKPEKRSGVCCKLLLSVHENGPRFEDLNKHIYSWIQILREHEHHNEDPLVAWDYSNADKDNTFP